MTRPRSALVCGENGSCTFHKQRFATPKAAVHPCDSQTIYNLGHVCRVLSSISASKMQDKDLTTDNHSILGSHQNDSDHPDIHQQDLRCLTHPCLRCEEQKCEFTASETGFDWPTCMTRVMTTNLILTQLNLDVRHPFWGLKDILNTSSLQHKIYQVFLLP